MAAPLGVRIRERPSLHLNISVQAPAGLRQRWGFDDPNPIYAPKNLSFGDSMPGGFDRFSCTLQRNPRLSYPDLEPLSKLTVAGPGGAVAWQGRMEKFPDTAGYQSQVAPEGVGYQAALEDDNSAREIYVDQDLSRWQGSSVQRKINLLNAGLDPTDGTVVPDETTGQPSFATAFPGAWARAHVSEGWYDAKGIPIGSLYTAWKINPLINPADVKWGWAASLGDGDTAFGADGIAIRSAGPGTNGVIASTATRRWAMVLLEYAAATTGNDGLEYAVFWTCLAIYGTHGLPLVGAFGFTQAQGVLASDVTGHALRRWVSEIAYSIGPEGTIKPGTFPIQQLAFTEPTTAAEIIKQAIRFELPDWAIWEGPTYYQNPRGEQGRHWQARVGPAQLQQTGSQISHLWNGVVVQYQDITGQQRMVGPPGFAGGIPELEDARLLDTDPENPLNQEGEKKWALLKMGTSTVEGAKAVGRKFLEEQKQLETSGQASLVGHVEDENGTLWPAWSVRSGDTVAFLDAADPAPRRVVSKNYDDPSKTNALQLEQPPDSMQALLERLSASLIGTGFT